MSSIQEQHMVSKIDEAIERARQQGLGTRLTPDYLGLAPFQNNRENAILVRKILFGRFSFQPSAISEDLTFYGQTEDQRVFWMAHRIDDDQTLFVIAPQASIIGVVFFNPVD